MTLERIKKLIKSARLEEAKIACDDELNKGDISLEKQKTLHRLKGNAFFMENKYDPAIAEYDESLAVVSQDSESHAKSLVNKVYALAMLGRFDEAKKIRNENMKIVFERQHRKDLMLFMAYAYLEHRDFQSSQIELNAIEDSVRDSSVWACCGDLAYEQDDFSVAERNYRRVIRLANSEGRVENRDYAYLKLGDIFFLRKEYDLAIHSYDQISETSIYRSYADFNKALSRESKYDRPSQRNTGEITDYFCAYVSNLVYATSLTSSDRQLLHELGWELQATSSDKKFSGRYSHEDYFAMVFKSLKTKHIVIAHRGTIITGPNLNTDFQLIVGHFREEHFDQAYKFSQEIIIKHLKDYPDSVVMHTGHSLGGATALYCVMCHEAENPKDNRKEFFAIAFDSPGIKDHCESKFNGHSSTSRVREYLSDPDIVNSAGKHLDSKPVRLSTPRIIRRPGISDVVIDQMGEIISCFSRFGIDQKQKHAMSSILSAFSREKGVPFNRKKVVHWPENIEKCLEFDQLANLVGSRDPDPASLSDEMSERLGRIPYQTAPWRSEFTNLVPIEGSRKRPRVDSKIDNLLSDDADMSDSESSEDSEPSQPSNKRVKNLPPLPLAKVEKIKINSFGSRPMPMHLPLPPRVSTNGLFASKLKKGLSTPGNLPPTLMVKKEASDAVALFSDALVKDQKVRKKLKTSLVSARKSKGDSLSLNPQRFSTRLDNLQQSLLRGQSIKFSNIGSVVRSGR